MGRLQRRILAWFMPYNPMFYIVEKGLLNRTALHESEFIP